MALSLPGGASSGRVGSSDNTAWPLTSVGTLFLKFKPNWSFNDAADHDLFQNGYSVLGTYRLLRMEKFTDNNVYMGIFDQGTGDFRVVTAASGAMFTNGTYTNHTLIWSTSTGTSYYTDNVQRGATVATANIPDVTLNSTNDESFGSGLQLGVFLNAPSDGTFAEYGRWNRILTSDELATLQLGYAPLVFTNGLLEYRSFADYTGTHFSASQGPDLTPDSQNATIVAHPYVVNPPAVGLLL